MPVKQIPDLNWEKENLRNENTELDTKTDTENRTGPTLRSSKKNQTVNAIKEKAEATPNKNKEEICANSNKQLKFLCREPTSITSTVIQDTISCRKQK